MLETLSDGFRKARLKVQGKTELNEDNIADALRDVRVSLLEADVELGVVKAFLARVKERSLGDVVTLKGTGKNKGTKLSAGDHFIKVCHDELMSLMGPVDTSLELSGEPALIMMCGLQGSGKTTTSGKLAKRLLAQGRKPMLVAADIYRPAAIDQLMTLGRKLGVPVFSIKGMDPVQLCKLAVTQARNVGRDTVIFDTAGRLAIDNALMQELVDIKAQTKPDNILFVCDAMIGQDAVRTAKEFDAKLDFTGFVLTKLDGDARGGAALSIKEVTGKPIKFLGMGEGLGELEDFRPQGLADRILGFGDVVGLVQDFEKHMDQDEAEADAKKMLRGDFTFDDFLKQLETVQKMGSLKSLFERLPFFDDMKKMIPAEALDDKELVKVKAVIHSMTRQERNFPDVLDGNQSRWERIAKGCGREPKEIGELYERFVQARAMMKQMGDSGLFGGLMGGGGMPAMPGMPGLGVNPGLTPPGTAPNPPRELSAKEKAAKRKARKNARKSRKRNKK
ncbi:MAG: signal recognition particle protein [Myxococcota bacterium]|nr:signal recognition particle protein [Myxococcota bacterium]